MISYYRFTSWISEKFFKNILKEECEPFIKDGARIIDIGCGSGTAAKLFKDFFKAEVMGVDVKDNRIYPVPFKLIDGRNLPFNDSYFDIALIICVLHHIEDFQVLLGEAKRVAKTIIIYEDIPEGFFSKLVCSIHIFFSSRNMLYPSVSNLHSFKTRQQWRDIFNSLGLSVISEKRMKRPFLFKQFQFVLQSK
ncbi:MAG: class I SAM-dependent methyltransferase [Candidatus Nealsonbacteria bacterium]|nr:class I SAM-dependent methyltransferase [Candidatus Nealsonbacteria bacterium]